MPNHERPTHVVVVGAGIVGAAIAFHLTRRGARVTLIDAGEPGRQTTAVSFAWINARDKNPRHYHDLNRRSLDMWDRFARTIGVPEALTWGGELRWAATRAGAEELIDRVAVLQSWGYPIRLLDAAEIEQMEPGLVTGPVATASYTPIDGQVDQVRVVQACIEKAEAHGATIHTHTPVTGFQGEDGRIKAVHTPDGPIPCDAAVIAGGPDTAEIARLAGIEVPTYWTFGASVLTEPVAPVLKTVAVVHAPRDVEPRLHVRQLPNGQVVIQGGAHGERHDESLGRTDEEVALMVDTVQRYLPALNNATIAEVRRGRRPIPQDGLPILGYTKTTPNLYLATMHSGVTLAALVGELATIEILDGACIDLLEPYRLERFQL